MNEDILNKKYESHAIDPTKLFHGYLNKQDWRVKENASTAFSLGAFQNYMSGAMTANYWLDYVYPSYSKDKKYADVFRLPNGEVDEYAISSAHRNCDFHIHDLCFDKSATFFLEDGTEMSFEEAEKKGIVKAKVLSYDEENKEVVVKDAVNIGKRSLNNELFQVEFENGDTLPPCTNYHKFLTKRGWVAAEDLVEGDEIIET